MLWIILGITIIMICLFLLVVVRNASNNMDEETRRIEDEEQIKAVEEYMRKKQNK